MSAAIDFYFDFSSPYGYFAAERIDELAAKYGRDVEWHPILLGAVFKSTGGVPLTEAPMKGKYSLHDFERSARFHDIPYNRPPAFPLPTQVAARAMLWLQSKYGADQSIKFAKLIYQGMFVHGINIAEPLNVLDIARKNGFDTEGMAEGVNTLSIKNQLKAEIDLAMAKGVFGSPFVIVDGESFWGFDRFDQIEAMLKSGKI
ncbi:2-hydroxychromene-2-carboxylate isomerase [Glaciimonas sp. PAMC28666]|uniref:2-hydroxychromene-2-carboxylate isomerase n=1 Tax=Glaciimonas sp. PAMC28666 TaxID=2807626 RepID=UPI001964681B|nr:2-hydroxychromene-2-carboxylate isomerase [Glaciimonas sp. PAMC28666]QRX84303.1 2-hydroxychromene-2-carboxylate isomerase [Glaciimonas sp. PAMC28666]